MQAEIHYKVCDAGLYWLTDQDGRRIARWKGQYVPSAFLNHDRSSNSDYIVLTVTPSGQIERYTQPSINIAEWSPWRTGQHRIKRNRPLGDLERLRTQPTLAFRQHLSHLD